jgi:hypothetical protein
VPRAKVRREEDKAAAGKEEAVVEAVVADTQEVAVEAVAAGKAGDANAKYEEGTYPAFIGQSLTI